jgi:hypothetical protein
VHVLNLPHFLLHSRPSPVCVLCQGRRFMSSPMNNMHKYSIHKPSVLYFTYPHQDTVTWSNRLTKAIIYY